MELIIKSLEDFFSMTRCSKEGARGLGKTSQINDVNVLEYLNILGLHVGDLVKLKEYEMLIYILNEEGTRKFHDAVASFNAKKTYDTIIRKMREERRFNKKMIREYEEKDRKYMALKAKERKKRIRRRKSVGQMASKKTLMFEDMGGEECIEECQCFVPDEREEEDDRSSTDEEDLEKEMFPEDEDVDYRLNYDQIELAKEFA